MQTRRQFLLVPPPNYCASSLRPIGIEPLREGNVGGQTRDLRCDTEGAIDTSLPNGEVVLAMS